MVDILAGYWIVRGHVSRGQLYADGLKIEDLPVQSDMTRGRSWVRPGNEADVVVPAALVTTMDKRQWADGGDEFSWPLRALSPKMTDHLFVDYWQEVYNDKFTVQTFNRATGAWEAYTCEGNFPDLEQAELAGSGYDKATIDFYNCDVALDGPDITLVVEYDT